MKRPLEQRLYNPRTTREFQEAQAEHMELYPWEYETEEETEEYRIAEYIELEGYMWRENMPDAPVKIP